MYHPFEHIMRDVATLKMLFAVLKLTALLLYGLLR